MRRRKDVFDDPVVDEIRAIRARILAKSDGTVKGYLETLHRAATERAEKDAAVNGNGKAVKARTARTRKSKTRTARKGVRSRVTG